MVGFEQVRFKDPVNVHFICSICNKVLQDPVEIKFCSHTFCRSCIQQHLECQGWCPIDKQLMKVGDLQDAEATKALIDGLKINCHYAPIGCKQYVRLGLLDAHVRLCHFALLGKDCKKCGAKLQKNDAESHSCVTYLIGENKAKDIQIDSLKKGITTYQNKVEELKAILDAKEKEVEQLVNGEIVEKKVNNEYNRKREAKNAKGRQKDNKERESHFESNCSRAAYGPKNAEPFNGRKARGYFVSPKGGDKPFGTRSRTASVGHVEGPVAPRGQYMFSGQRSVGAPFGLSGTLYSPETRGTRRNSACGFVPDMQAIDTLTGEDDTETKEEVNIIIPPDVNVGALIGPKGCIHKLMEAESGAKISVDNTGPKPCVTVVGVPVALEMAQRLVFPKLTKKGPLEVLRMVPASCEVPIRANLKHFQNEKGVVIKIRGKSEASQTEIPVLIKADLNKSLDVQMVIRGVLQVEKDGPEEGPGAAEALDETSPDLMSFVKWVTNKGHSSTS